MPEQTRTPKQQKEYDYVRRTCDKNVCHSRLAHSSLIFLNFVYRLHTVLGALDFCLENPETKQQNLQA